MRPYAPVLFSILSALFVAERAINGGAFAAHAPQVAGLHDMASLRAGDGCVPKADLLQTLALTGARLLPEAAPFCTDQPNVTDWIAATEAIGTRHLAFDAQGCLAVWEQAPCR